MTYPSGLTADQRAQVDRAREVAADRAEQQQRAKERQMSMRKTAQGDRVERFPDLSGRGKRLGGIREELTEAFEEAERAADLAQRMGAVHKVDADRFPVVSGGDH
ncbi:hypothetical protein ISU10_11200 [Nocardioides agariphilus]|uniref:Uncharacterized protein n=1 Tax=Nocardioides agariphilus TaxID=433664 RepID=A0A930VKG2_9ACTN|nr:hypothetical protein [Nocardioides agariphilus]MBF4768333.1 hypothetical protein [Nocardioides agariphilus]